MRPKKIAFQAKFITKQCSETPTKHCSARREIYPAFAHRIVSCVGRQTSVLAVDNALQLNDEY